MADGNFAGGDGTESNPYLIEDAHDLNAMRDDLNAHYRLASDIDLNTTPYNEGDGWTPISSIRDAEGGVDGNFNSINNLYINTPETSNVGLLGEISGSFYVKNLRMDNVFIVGANNVGALVGSGRINGTGRLENISVVGEVSGIQAVGGLMGNNYEAFLIANCVTECNVVGSKFVGGLLGNIRKQSVQNCSAKGTIVHTDSSGGGLVGRFQYGELKDSFSCSSFSGNSNGLIGFSQFNPTISNCFWDTDVSGTIVSDGGIGLTTLEMKTAQTFIDVGWESGLNDNGDPIWILEDSEYPKLWFEQEPNKLRYLIKSEDRVYTIA